MFSQTIEYSLRALMYLASLDGTPVTSERIAAQTQVPAGYLSKVMRDLVIANLVSSFRGPNGGFVLARPAAQITVLDAVNAVDPIRRIHKCPLNNPEHSNLCPLHRSLDDAMAHLEETLRTTTLAGVLEGGSKGCRGLIAKPTQPEKHSHDAA